MDRRTRFRIRLEFRRNLDGGVRPSTTPAMRKDRFCKPISCILLAAFAVVFGPITAWAASNHYYYNFKEKQSLSLNLEKIAVRDQQSYPDADVLSSFGIAAQNIEPYALEHWSFAKTPPEIATTGAMEELLTEISDQEGVDFVSPLFTNELGGQLIISKQILVRFHSDVDPEVAASILEHTEVGEIIDVLALALV